MSGNGAFLTSQLPVTTNAAGSDRVLILWNAIANVSLGSGTPQTMMIGLSDFINSAMSTIEGDLMTFGTLSLGNSTINTVINSTSLYIQTNLGTVFAVNTTGAIVGNGAGITSLPAPGANSQILFNNSGTSAGAANLTWNGLALSIGNAATNTTVNSTVFMNGNTYINSTTFFTGNAGSVIVGNVTYNVAITPQSITVSNNGNTAWVVTGDGRGTIRTQFTVGNSTANAVVVPTALSIGNSTVNSSINTSSLVFQLNSTSNSILDGTIKLNANATQNSTVNSITYSFNYPGASIVRPYTSVLMGNNALSGNSNSTAQAVFPTGQKTLTLAATTTYLIDGMYIIANASSTGVGAGTQLQTSFGNSVAIGTLFYSGFGAVINSTSSGANTTQGMGYQAISNAATTVSSLMGVTANVSVSLKGAITTVGAVNITPQVSFAAATNSTPQILTGTYITFTPVSNSTAGTSNLYGTWV